MRHDFSPSTGFRTHSRYPQDPQPTCSPQVRQRLQTMFGPLGLGFLLSAKAERIKMRKTKFPSSGEYAYTVSFMMLLIPDLLRSNLFYRAKVYELRKNFWFDLGTGYTEIRTGDQVGHFHCFINKNFRHQKLRPLLTGFTTGPVHMCQI